MCFSGNTVMFYIIQVMYGVYVYFRGGGLWCIDCTKSLKESKYDPGMERSSADAKLKLQMCLLGVSRDVSVLVSHVDPSANVSRAAVVVIISLPANCFHLLQLWRPRPWTFGDLSCKLTMFFAECCTFCSILHITFISLERYVAVCWPFTAKTLVTRRRTRTIIGCIWLGAAISAAPVLIMVGVEDVGSEDQGLSGWRESSAWVGKEGEQGFIIGERERENEDAVLKEVTFEEIGKDKEINECSDKNGETKGFTGGDKTLEFKEWNEKEQDQGERAAKAEGAIRGEGKRTQNEMKEDEGGGGQDMDRGDRAQVDLRECRCTDYAVSSGLLSTMLILSNMYFLVPLCILGLVYSLIGRTLWLRSQNSRRDLHNRHIVKMLGENHFTANTFH